jgi:hypothetical protein
MGVQDRLIHRVPPPRDAQLLDILTGKVRERGIFGTGFIGAIGWPFAEVLGVGSPPSVPPLFRPSLFRLATCHPSRRLAACAGCVRLVRLGDLPVARG